MNWHGLLEKNGWKTEEVGNEPFHPLSSAAQLERQAGRATSKVTCSVGTSADYGGLKVSFTVSVECPQTDFHISMAGEAAFLKATELTNQGASFIGAPLLPMKV